MADGDLWHMVSCLQNLSMVLESMDFASKLEAGSTNSWMETSPIPCYFVWKYQNVLVYDSSPAYRAILCGAV